jgi:hypothetical protein
MMVLNSLFTHAAQAHTQLDDSPKILAMNSKSSPRLFQLLLASLQFPQSLRRSNHVVSHFLLTIRASNATSEFDLPQRYADSQFFAINWKLVTALPVPGMRFVKDDISARNLKSELKLKSQKGTTQACTSSVITVALQYLVP